MDQPIQIEDTPQNAQEAASQEDNKDNREVEIRATFAEEQDQPIEQEIEAEKERRVAQTEEQRREQLEQHREDAQYYGEEGDQKQMKHLRNQSAQGQDYYRSQNRKQQQQQNQASEEYENGTFRKVRASDELPSSNGANNFTLGAQSQQENYYENE